MALSDELKAQIEAHFQVKIGMDAPLCTLCGNVHKMALRDEAYSIQTIHDGSTGSASLIALRCTNCGAMTFFGLETAGMTN